METIFGCVYVCLCVPLLRQNLKHQSYWMLELSHSQISHKRSSVLQQNHTGDETSERDGRKEMRDGDVVLLWVNWFFMYLNFHPRLNFLFIFHNLWPPSCLSPFFISISSICLPIIHFFFFLYLSFLDLSLLTFFSLLPWANIFLTL